MSNLTTNLDDNTLMPLDRYLERSSALELARRSLFGAPAYAAISLIMLMSTPMMLEYGWLVYVEVALLITLGVVRYLFALGFEARYDKIGERAVVQFTVITALQSLALGVEGSMVLWEYWPSQEVVLTIVLAAGCIAAGTSALSVRRSAHIIFLICVLAPLTLSVFVVGGFAKALLISGFLILMAFLVQDGGLAKHTYMQQLKANYAADLARRQSATEALARKEFLNKISFQLRTPINSIIGMSTLLLDEDLQPRQREFATIIRNSGQTLMSLTGNIPGSVKTRNANTDIFSLQESVNKLVKAFQMEATAKGIILDVQLQDLPESVVFLDDNYLEQVLVNLLDHAFKHSDPNRVTIKSRCQDVDDNVTEIEISVCADGKDIRDNELDGVFSAFDATNTNKIHNGKLWLPIVKGLAELMGGKVEVQTTEGQGSKISLTIRVQNHSSLELVPGDEIVIGDTHDALADDLGQGCPHSILVVEDHAINRRVLCLLLRKMGYRVDEAADGHEGVANAMNKNYDLIFMDVRMPNMSGIEATRWIREHYDDKELRIVALTGDATQETRDRCIGAGMDDFIAKPVQVEQLEAILRLTSRAA